MPCPEQPERGRGVSVVRLGYPTHATAYYVGVTHGSFLELSCHGTAPFEKSERQPNATGNLLLYPPRGTVPGPPEG